MKAKKSKSKKVKQEVAQESVGPVVEQVETMATPVRESKEIIEPMTNKDRVKVVLYSVLLFLAMTVQTGRMTMILIGLALVLSIGKTPMKNLRAHISIPVIGLILFVMMNGFAALYSDFGDTAAAELYKIMAAFSVVVILLMHFQKKHVRGLLWGFAIVCAVIALLCVDIGSWGKLFEVFNAMMTHLGTDYSAVLENSQGLRINGIYNDANLTGALLGPAIFVSLYLAHSSEKSRDRFFALSLLGISAVSFLIAMSRGALLAFGISALIYLAIEGRQTRTALFFLMLSAGVSALCCGVLAMLNMNTGSVIPHLMSALSGAIAFIADRAIGTRLVRKLQGHGKLVAGVCGAFVIVLCLGVVVAFQKTEPFRFVESGNFTRGMSLSSGSYTVSGDWETSSYILLDVQGQSKEQLLMDQYSSFYLGPLDDATFVIPEGTMWVRFIFYSDTGTVLRQVILSGGTEIPLQYTYIPDIISSRLQDGMLVSHNFQQRLQYIRDGITLWKQSPVIGHGLSSTEHLLLSVQPFHYESLYLHNHLIQVMADMGIVGLALFLVVLAAPLALLILRRKTQTDPLAVMLIACWSMLNLHSLMEINFSIRMFQCAAFFLLMLPVIQYAVPFTHRKLKQIGYVVFAALWLQLAGTGTLLGSHRSVEREAAEFATGDAVEFMETMRDFVKRDPFSKEQYQLNFVGNAPQFNLPEYNTIMYQYVEDLRNSGTYTACSGLARYYYLPMGDFEQLFACSREGIAQVASDCDAWNLQMDFYRNEVLQVAGEEQLNAFLNGILAFDAYLAQFNSSRLEEIVLSDENQTFLDVAKKVSIADVPPEVGFLMLVSSNPQF